MLVLGNSLCQSVNLAPYIRRDRDNPMECMFKDWANPFAFRFILPHISHRDRDNPMEHMFADWAIPFARLFTLPYTFHRDRDNPMERMFKDWANPFARLLKTIGTKFRTFRKYQYHLILFITILISRMAT